MLFDCWKWQNWIVDRSTALGFTVFVIWFLWWKLTAVISHVFVNFDSHTRIRFEEQILRKKIGIRRFRICEKHVMNSLLHAIIRLWSSSAFMSMHMRWSHASQLVPSYWHRPSKWWKPAKNSLLQFVCCDFTIFSKQRLSFPFPVNARPWFSKFVKLLHP